MIYERHRILSELLISLGVPEDIATQDACRIEHVISAESFDAVKKVIRRCREKEDSAPVNPSASPATSTQS